MVYISAPCERRLRHILTLSRLSSGCRSLFSAAFHACRANVRFGVTALTVGFAGHYSNEVKIALLTSNRVKNTADMIAV